MAVAEQRTLPPQYVEDLQKDYGKQLTATTAAPLDTSKFAPQVAAQDPFQTQAYTMAGQGNWCVSTLSDTGRSLYRTWKSSSFHVSVSTRCN